MAKERYSMRMPRVILGFFGSLGTGVLLTWSYYREPLLQMFPEWTFSDLSLIFSVHNLMVSFMMAFSGFIMKKMSTRTAYVLTAVCFLVGLGGFHFLPPGNQTLAFAMAFVLYGFIAPIGVGAGCVLSLAIYPAWYPERAGSIGGIMVFAFNSAALLAGALASILLPRVGILDTMAATGVVVAIFMLASAPLGVYPGKKDKLPPAPVRPENKTSYQYKTKEMLKSPAFWSLFFFHALFFTSSLIFADHAAGIAVYFGAAALIGMLFAPAKGISCVAAGWLMDKFTTIGSMIILSSSLMVASGVLLVGAFQNSAVLVMAGMIMVSLSCGGASTIRATALRFLFGNEHYQQNIGVSYLSVVVSAILAYCASLIIEALGGSYTGVFFVILSAGILSIAFTAHLHIFMKKRANVTDRSR